MTQEAIGRELRVSARTVAKALRLGSKTAE
jgi:hypothetical protein